MIKKTLVFLMLVWLCPVFSQNASSMEPLKKEASQLFEAEDYSKAYKMYSQLVANFPKDAEYNFKLGVCMIYAEPDKKKCLPYLLFAAKNPNEQTKDISFYLGKAYHINYQFNEAIKNYSEYKRTAPAAKQKKLAVDREITACNNGKRLLSNLTDLEVKSKKELNEADYFRSYDLKDIGGKLLVKPEDFNSSADKKKKDKSVVFLPKAGNRVYYSSYGENTDSGKDIYYATKMPDGTYGPPKKVSGINTEFDEDYPFIHPNGQTLYFASKGHNSMGGYDIFKSTYIESSDSWSQPVNMEFPINSPDDDFLFVTDSLEQTAYFSTGRQSPPGKTDVLKISTVRKPIDVLVIDGDVVKDNAEQSVKSKITITNVENNKPSGVYYAEDDGSYQLNLANGAKLLFTVETPGFKTQSQEIILPMAETSKAIKQSISYTDGILKITNDFDAPVTDDNYLQYLKVIEQKAKLDVNEGQNNLALNTAGSDITAKKTPMPELISQTSDSANVIKKNPNQGLDNTQLANMAKEDAILSKNEAVQLKQDSNDALEVGQKQKDEAAKKIIAADEAVKAAEAIENADEKKVAIEKATLLKQEAENEDAVANKILEFGKSLDTDATVKEKEASLNEQYAIELDKAITSKNKDKASVARLEDLQKQINELSSQKNASEDMFNAIKNNADEKEKQIAQLEKINSGIKTNLDEIKTEIADNDTQLAATKKKKDKEIIINQTTELKTQQAEKEKEISANELEIKKLNDDLGGLKSELDIATRIKTQAIVPVAVNPPPIVTNTVNAVEKLPVAAVAKKTDKPIAKNTSKTNAAKEPIKQDLTPLTASTGSEAITKLDKLSAQLTVNDAELFDFNSYQNQQAQNLKIEADAKINDAIAQQKKLKDVINASKKDIGESAIPANNQSALELSKDGDNLAVKAQAIRKEANALPADKRNVKLAEAKKLDAAADEKYIAAAGVTSKDNKSLFDVNADNVKQLITEGKAVTADQEEATRLNDEATTAFKKAGEIRTEADALTSAGAKLGSLSNAEEIEAEALLKQKQAVELLKKSSPDFALKTVGQPQTMSGEGTDINAKLQNVNSGINDLVNIKISSYQKLYEANQLEVEAIFAGIATNQAILDKTPGLKSEFISGSAKIQTATTLKLKSDSIGNPNDQLYSLSLAIKKQTEALKQLGNLNVSLNQAALKKEAALAKQTQSQPKNNTIVSNANDVPVKTNVEATDPVTLANNKAIDIAELAKQDTTAAELVTYFDTQTTALNNSQAQAGVNKSIATIKSSENEIKAIESTINNPQAAEVVVTPSELKTKADVQLAEADQLSAKGLEARKEAETKTGDEKEKLLTSAVEFESQVQVKKNEAAKLTQTANQTETETNNHAIAEMLDNLKNDNAELFADLNSRNKELLTAREQSRELREEAENLTNNAAKLGAISNVEEKEAELIQKQNQIIVELKKQYPNYEVKPYSTAASETPESLAQKKIQLREKQYASFTSLTNAFSLEFESAKNNVPVKLNSGQLTLKQNAEDLNAESKRLLIEASQEQDENKKIKLFALSAKSGRAANEQLNKLIPKQVAIAKSTPKTKAKTTTADLTKVGNAVTASNKKGPKKNSNTDPYAALSNNTEVAGENNPVAANDSTPGAVIKTAVVTKAPKKKATPKITAAAKKTSVPENVNKPEEDPVLTTVVKKTTPRSTVKIEGLEVTQGNAYSESKPIPLDSKIEDGLVFRVQIGAFKTRLPNDAFKGLSPLNGETAGNGYIRYTAGNFNKVENANAVKNDLRALGYSDAFVVVYYNGKRITLSEALSILEKEGKTIDTNAPQSAGITAAVNIPKVQAPAQNAAVNVQDNTVVVAKELEKINGLLYTVQIGVYTKQITRRQLLNLSPIFTERMTNGLYRYTAGIYNNADKIITDKRRVVDLGVKDAFVSAYLNGKRIPFNDGKTKQAQDTSIQMEAENPIIFDGSAPIQAPANLTNNTTANETPAVAITTVQPFKNNVSKYPEATPENGIKETEEGVTFKVQIGAYSRQVPNDVAAKYSAITTWPIENKQIKGLFIYNIGSFSSAKFAKTLKDEAIRLGITDAFISVYDDGVKLYGDAASAALAK